MATLFCLSNATFHIAPANTQPAQDETEDGEALVANANQNYNAAGTYATPQKPEPASRAQENNIRNLMRSLGVGTREMQDIVISHINSESQAREPMRAASGRLLQAARTPGVTDAQLSVLLNDCRVSFDTDKMRRAEALSALKTKIGHDLTPRIESMILLLGLEGDVIITLPTPTLLTQMQRERQQLLKMVDGLKIESDSLRRERDDLKAECDAYQKVNAPINPNGLYNVAPATPQSAAPRTEKLTDVQKELVQLREENANLKKESKRLQRENTALLRALKNEPGDDKKDKQ